MTPKKKDDGKLFISHSLSEALDHVMDDGTFRCTLNPVRLFIFSHLTEAEKESSFRKEKYEWDAFVNTHLTRPSSISHEGNLKDKFHAP